MEKGQAILVLAMLLALQLFSCCSAQRLIYKPCPEDQEYTDCSSCPSTCANYHGRTNEQCEECREGCFCPPGLVELESEGKCIAPEECPDAYPQEPSPPLPPRYPIPTELPDPYPYPTEPPYPDDPYPTEPPYPQELYPSEPYPNDPNPTEPPNLTGPVYPYPSQDYPYDPYEPYDPYDPYPFQYCELNEDEYGRPYYGAYDQYLSTNSYPPRLPPGYPTAPPSYPTLPPPYPTQPPPGYPTPPPPGYPTPPPPYPTRPPPGYPTPPPPNPTRPPPGYPTPPPPYPTRPPPGYPTPPPPYPTRPPPGYPTPPPPYPTRPPPGYPTPPPYPPYRPYPYPVPTTALPPRETYAVNLTLLTRTKRQAQQTAALPQCITSNECYQAPETCTGSGTQYDSCDRRCTCRNGQLVDCCRVRKEWRSMTQVERCRYVEVYHTVSSPGPYKACYDQLIQIHRQQFGSAIHEEDFFLPWHRWFILALENLLRQVDCKVTVPYWDWSAESQTWQNSIVWAPQCGFGGNGNPVTTGPFRDGAWELTPSAQSGGPLRRSFQGMIPDCAAVAMMQRLGVSEFSTWYSYVYNNLHNSMHCNIHGTMCSEDSANAPEFFLHHGFIDQVWAQWQNKGPGFKNYPLYSQNTDHMPGAFRTTPRDVFDLSNQPGCVRVCVQPPSRPCRVNTSYTPLCPREMNCYEYSPNKLAGLIYRPYPPVQPDAYKLFRVPPEKRRTPDRCAHLFNNPDDLYGVLKSNGYYVGSTTYRPALGEVQLDSYIFRPSRPVYPTAPANGTTHPPPPSVCRPYVDPYLYGDG